MLDAMVPAFAATGGATERPSASSASAWHLACTLLTSSPKLPAPTTRRPPTCKPLQNLRSDFTVVSGSSHPGVSGGHTAEGSIYSACPNQQGGAVRNTRSRSTS